MDRFKSFPVIRWVEIGGLKGGLGDCINWVIF